MTEKTRVYTNEPIPERLLTPVVDREIEGIEIGNVLEDLERINPSTEPITSATGSGITERHED